MSGQAGMNCAGDHAHAAMVGEALGEAISAMQPLRQASIDIGAAFRRFDIDHANGELQGLAQNLASLLVLTEMVSSVVAASAPAPSRSEPAASVEAIDRSVDRLLAARTAGDWIQVADLLEHEVPPMLDRWKVVLVSWQRQVNGLSAAH